MIKYSRTNLNTIYIVKRPKYQFLSSGIVEKYVFLTEVNVLSEERLSEKAEKIKQFGYSPLRKQCQGLNKAYGFDKKGYHGYKNILIDKKEDNDKNNHTETKYQKSKIFFEQKNTF